MSNSLPNATQQRNSGDDNGKDSCYYGDACVPKQSNSVRVMFQNINGFGYTHNSVKSQSIRKLMVNKEVDIMALAEMNINWSKLRRNNTLPQVCKKWFKTSKATVAYNQHERRMSTKSQPGGTTIISVGDMALRHHKHKYDVKKLGRWSLQSFQGKNGLTTRIVSVYVPILMTEYGERKVSTQQQRVLLQLGIKTHYIKVFFQDLWDQIDKWINNGNHLIICGD